MSYEEIVIDVRNLSTCNEIYNTPRDRLKQLVLPRLHHTANSVGVEHLYLFNDRSATPLLKQPGAENIQFEPAIFDHNDMFLR